MLSKIMQTHLISIPADCPILAAAEKIRPEKISAF
jgi:hypothetical protein